MEENEWGPWTEWHGGDCPVQRDVSVQCRGKDPNTSWYDHVLMARTWNWQWRSKVPADPGLDDITRYRIKWKDMAKAGQLVPEGLITAIMEFKNG